MASSRIAGFAMRAHDAATCRDPGIQHGLHDGALIEALGQSHAVALQIAARPIRLVRSTDPELSRSRSVYRAARRGGRR